MPEHGKTAARLLDKIGTSKAGGLRGKEAARDGGQTRIPRDSREESIARQWSSHDRTRSRLAILQLVKMLHASGEHGLIHDSGNDDVSVLSISGCHFGSCGIGRPDGVVS
jgi:hypothetical protein